VGGYSLSILGPLELTGRDGAPVQSVLHQPKRAALLAFMAAAPAGARTRAELLEVFWADSGEEEGRHALSQAIYYLRRSLGRTALVVDGETVGLAADVVRTDIATFRQHLASGRQADAVALVRGDLLERFPSIPDFDRWLDGARETVRRLLLDALDQLWRDATDAGDPRSAIQWAQQACALAPYDEAPIQRLLCSLVADAQNARAHDVFERFAAGLRRDLDLEPSDAVSAILASTPAPAPAPPATPPLPEASPQTVVSAPAAEPIHAVEPAPATLPLAAPVRRRAALAGWALRVLLPAAMIALVLGAVTRGMGIFAVDRDVAAAVSANRIGIFPFLYRGDPAQAYLGDGIPELIGIIIQSLDQVSMIDPRALAPTADGQDMTAPNLADAAERARALGAGHFVVGSVVEAGGQLHVTARLHRSAEDIVATVSGRAVREEDLFALVDGLVRQLIGSDAFPGTSELERSAAQTSSSLPALRHFFRGEKLFREGRYPDAAAAFDAAVQEDSAFALAMYRGAIAQLWSDGADFEQARTKVTRALEYRDRVSALEGDLFAALHEFLRGRLLHAERLYESVLIRQPENIEAWFQLAETRFHYGGLHGRSTVASEDAWRRVITLNPEHHAALIHLSAITALRSSAELDSLERRVNVAADGTMSTPQVRALKVFSSGTEQERIEFLDQLRRYAGAAVSSTAAYAARYLRDPEAGARIAAVMTDAARPDAERAEGHLLLAHFMLARGQRAAAQREVERALRLDRAQTDMHALLLATLPTATVTLRSQGGVEVPIPAGVPVPAASAPPGDFDGGLDSGLRLYAHALAYRRAGGEEGALVSAARQLADADGDAGAHTLFDVLALGLIAERDLQHEPSAPVRADLARALTHVERWYENLRSSHLRSLARERFLLAEAEIAIGRDDAAEALLIPIGENSVAELPYLAPTLIRIGEIRERDSDPQGAITAYRRVLDLWSDAEPDLDQIRAEINARIDVLDE
jgi:DNA-binding SARP family transcriptional activator/TolB-like protein